MAQIVKNLPAMQEPPVGSLGWEGPLQEGMATHSSILAWIIPWTKECDRLYSPGGHKESDMIEQLSPAQSITLIHFTESSEFLIIPNNRSGD